MNWRLMLLENMPGLFKRRKLKELVLFTARAFSARPPDVLHFSFARILHEFAVFTGKEAKAAIAAQNEGIVAERLFTEASAFAANLRKLAHLASHHESLRLLKILYQLIGIDMCIAGHEIRITCCYFSQFYSPDICRLISSLDAGIVHGLTSGGQLTFSKRITEGHACCQGLILLKASL
jgi:hypothetical protein